MLVLKSKKVNIQNLSIHIYRILGLVVMCCKKVNGDDYIVTITSANDSKHSKNSLHYKNLAIDIRTKDMKDPNTTAQLLYESFRYSGYDVVLESDHIHIEYDPK